MVYAKTPLGGPAQVLEDLNRYTHRTAISNERIRAITAEALAFSVSANDQGGKHLRPLPGVEFVRRFLLQVLPNGIKHILLYGVLAPCYKGVKLSDVRLALQLPLPNPQSMESAQGFLARVATIDVSVCPCCVCSHRSASHNRAGGRSELWASAQFGVSAQWAVGGAARCAGKAHVGPCHTAAQRHDAWVLS